MPIHPQPNVDAVDDLAARFRAISQRLNSLERAATSGGLAGRNKADNGAMWIAQRGLGVLAGITTDANQRFVDRSLFRNNALGAMTYQTQADGPPNTGLTRCLETLVATADAAPAAGDYGIFVHALEGLTLRDLFWGTPAATPVTVSWWQKTNYLAGPFVAELFRNEATQRSMSIVVPPNTAAGVWQRRSATFPGDTTGPPSLDNQARLLFNLFCGAGTTYTSGGTLLGAWTNTVNNRRAVGVGNLAATANNYLRITGLQIEVGANASPFEYRAFADDLARCQRYAFYPGYNVPQAGYVLIGFGMANATTSGVFTHFLPVTMRDVPTWDANFVPISNYFVHDRVGFNTVATAVANDAVNNPSAGGIQVTTAAVLTPNRPYQVLKNAGLLGCGGWSADI